MGWRRVACPKTCVAAGAGAVWQEGLGPFRLVNVCHAADRPIHWIVGARVRGSMNFPSDWELAVRGLHPALDQAPHRVNIRGLNSHAIAAGKLFYIADTRHAAAKGFKLWIDLHG